MTRVLVTGGLGVVGSNYSAHCLGRGDSVVVLDNFARGNSSKENAQWLKNHSHADNLKIISGNVADVDDVAVAATVFGGVDVVIHAAAQSSVNHSLVNPKLDFTSNVVGTFTVLEYLRENTPKTKFIFMASNKVYDVTSWPTQEQTKRHAWVSRRVGPEERFPFYTDAKEPYGASKISGLYYTRCYAAMYGLPAVVVVPSGMAGIRQFGRAAQGWLGWFIIATLLGLKITIHGDGMQVRDMCDVSDVCIAFDLIINATERFPGEIFNLGGGPRNAISLLEALAVIQERLGREAKIDYAEWRPQDNKVYISNIEKLISLGWFPKVSVRDLIHKMCDWALSEKTTLERVYLSGTSTN